MQLLMIFCVLIARWQSDWNQYGGMDFYVNRSWYDFVLEKMFVVQERLNNDILGFVLYCVRRFTWI